MPRNCFPEDIFRFYLLCNVNFCRRVAKENENALAGIFLCIFVLTSTKISFIFEFFVHNLR